MDFARRNLLQTALAGTAMLAFGAPAGVVGDIDEQASGENGVSHDSKLEPGGPHVLQYR